MSRIYVVIVMLMGMLAIAVGQAPGVFNPFAGISAPEQPTMKTGSWTMYKIESKDKDDSGKMKLSVVGEEECNGQKCRWFEIEIWDNAGNHNISKILMKDELSRGESGYFSIIVKNNDEPAYQFEFDIPPDTTEIAEEPTKAEKSASEDENTGSYYAQDEYAEVKIDKETIVVPAGKFDCQHILTIDKETNEKAEMWFSPKVPVTTIVKIRSSDNMMELLDYGTEGATSAITETPQKMNMNQMIKDAMEEETEEGVKDAIKEGLKSIFGR